MSIVDGILGRYELGEIQEYRRLYSGLMHATYIVDADRGRHVLQRLHPKLSTVEILADFEAVTHHLAAQHFSAPCLVHTREGERVVVDAENRWWRLATWVPGETKNKVQSTLEAEQGARALGRFHRAIAQIEHDFGSQHPLHDTRSHLSALIKAVENPAYAPHLATVQAEVDRILALLPTLIFPDELPQRVVHGDPKISNILFRGDEAIGLIDLDTCNRHTILVDLGDAVRSWCRDGGEDERQKFQIDRFEAILRGYAAEGPPLTPAEIEHLGAAGRLITMELASRFARDVLEDEYFAFDAERYPNRRAHNQARTRSMLYLADDMLAHRSAIESLVTRYFPTP